MCVSVQGDLPVTASWLVPCRLSVILPPACDSLYLFWADSAVRWAVHRLQLTEWPRFHCEWKMCTERVGGKPDILLENDKNKHPFRLQFWDNNPTYPLSEYIIPPKSVYMSAPLALSRRGSVKTQVSGPGASVGPPLHSISQIFLFSSVDGNFTFPRVVCSHAAPAQSDWISHFRSARRRVGVWLCQTGMNSSAEIGPVGTCDACPSPRDDMI